MANTDNTIHVKIGGKMRKFKLIVMRVEEFLENGKPDVVTIGREDSTFELSKDASKNVFVTGFISAENY